METKFNPLSDTPAFALLIGICSAIFLCGHGYSSAVSLLVSLLFVAVWIFLGTALRVKNYVEVFALALLLSFVLSAFCLYRQNIKREYPSTIDCPGTVVAERPWAKSNCALLISTEYGKAVVYSQKKDIPETGSKVRLNAATFDFRRAKQPRGFDEFLFWKARGADKRCVLFKLERLAPPNLFYRFRNGLERRINEKLPQRCADYMFAITLGERSKELSKLHRESGTSHLLAVSGFHVAILTGIAYALFRRKKYRTFLISAVVWGYVLLSGAAPGAMRAALMLQLALLSQCVGAPVNAFNSVSVAGVLLLLWNPYNFYDLGWRLSMLCALFVCTAEDSFDFVSASLVSMLAWFVAAAQSAFSFKKLPAAGLFMNVIAVPLFSLLFPLLLILCLPSLLGLPFGSFFAGLCEYLLEAWEIFANFAVGLCPYEFHYTKAMPAVSAFVFAWYAACRAHYPRINQIFVAVLSAILIVLCA